MMEIEAKSTYLEKQWCTSINWVVRIWDFELKKEWYKDKIIEGAKVWVWIYWLEKEKWETLENTKKEIIVVIPALTGTSKLFTSWGASQWDWWANWYDEWILNPNDNKIIISFDYFWGPECSSPDKHNLDFYDVPAEKQVEAWKKVLQKLWVKKINTLFWGSNWWLHINHWVVDKNSKYTPDSLIAIAWSFWDIETSKDFFKVQSDVINLAKDNNIDNFEEKIINLLNSNIWPILEWLDKNSLYTIFYNSIIDEINNFKNIKDKDEKNRITLAIARKIWFLKFVNPEFFEKFWKDKNWNELNNLENAKQNLFNYFENETKKFEKRFSWPTLALLCNWISKTKELTPEEFSSKISEKINLIILWIKEDNLFSSEKSKKYFSEVKEHREKWNHKWKTIFTEISWENSKIAWHDYFLWEEWIKVINKKLLNILENNFFWKKNIINQK